MHHTALQVFLARFSAVRMWFCVHDDGGSLSFKVGVRIRGDRYVKYCLRNLTCAFITTSPQCSRFRQRDQEHRASCGGMRRFTSLSTRLSLAAWKGEEEGRNPPSRSTLTALRLLCIVSAGERREEGGGGREEEGGGGRRWITASALNVFRRNAFIRLFPKRNDQGAFIHVRLSYRLRWFVDSCA
ncbi:hypothetical protein CYLTODRAFT_173122 [Cylindrobasidium torrendii FP15055 ss-10]|uniref:Secreted protein n=1 Tax=Cylindrobasidium torrendii FP15055 ss-10 TaxID=1314674 RepID=A0A0D7AX35_9AGAR|nr:hypothetical protein CYLTODRAFT_173122 [Cylindrobasidium torrendii FP15055 ss-10]